MEGVVERGAILGARWRLLAEASTALARSLDYKETLTNVVRPSSRNGGLRASRSSATTDR